MFFFKKAPPPPPPPKTKWISIAIPIIFAVIMGLLGIVYNGLAEEVKQKVDNETLQLLIQNQQLQIEQQQKQSEKQNDRIEEILNQLKDQRKDNNTSYSEQYTKPPLTPKEFQEYMKLTPDERKAFRSIHPSYENLPK